MLNTQSTLALGLILSITACALPESKASFTDNGLQKAAFDMQCDKEKLEVDELSPARWACAAVESEDATNT